MGPSSWILQIRNRHHDADSRTKKSHWSLALEWDRGAGTGMIRFWPILILNFWTAWEEGWTSLRVALGRRLLQPHARAQRRIRLQPQPRQCGRQQRVFVRTASARLLLEYQRGPWRVRGLRTQKRTKLGAPFPLAMCLRPPLTPPSAAIESPSINPGRQERAPREASTL